MVIPSLTLSTLRLHALQFTRPRTLVPSKPSLTLDPERKEPLQDTGCTPQLHVVQFRPVIRTLFEIREGRVPTES
jgi:hypothetical protein